MAFLPRVAAVVSALVTGNLALKLNPNTVKLSTNSTQGGTTAAAVTSLRAKFVASPHPQVLADLQKLHIDTSNMGHASASSPNGGTVSIMTFPSHEDQYVSGGVNSGGGWENQHVHQAFAMWQNLGHSKGNFLDVGANIGTWTLPLAAAMASTGKQAIAIEALPPIADHLRAGILANAAQNVILFPYAVGQPSVDNDVDMAYHWSNKGGSTVVGNTPWSESGHVQTFTVGLTTMDSILDATPAMSNVFYAKFDIEGNEGRMLEGAVRFFTQHAPCIIWMEMYDEMLQRTGYSMATIETKLSSLGYNILGKAGHGADWMYKQRDMAACANRMF